MKHTLGRNLIPARKTEDAIKKLLLEGRAQTRHEFHTKQQCLVGIWESYTISQSKQIMSKGPEMRVGHGINDESSLLESLGCPELTFKSHHRETQG